MSIKTFNARNNKAKKGISPVIATVILVAVAVVIAAALAGFASSLFGTYASQGGSIQVKSIGVSEATQAATFTLINSGNVKDTVTSVQALPHAPNNAPTTVPVGGTLDIAPGAQKDFTADITALGENNFTNGQTITVKITMQSGLQLTQSVVVTA